MDDPFVTCNECGRRWHGQEQKDSFVQVDGPDGPMTFCDDDTNCAASFAINEPGKYFQAAMAARKLIAQRRTWRKRPAGRHI